MEKNVKCMQVKSSEGKVVLSLYLQAADGIVLGDRLFTPSDRKPDSGNGRNGQNGGNGNGNGNGNGHGNGNDKTLMTDAQKRYLFRLLADRGIEKDAAYQHLKEAFQVDTLKEVTKSEASKAIERLLKENNNNQGGEANGIPF